MAKEAVLGLGFRGLGFREAAAAVREAEILVARKFSRIAAWARVHARIC